MLTETIIEDGQELDLSREQAEHLWRQRLICQCPTCGPTIWHFREEAVTFEEVNAELRRAYGLPVADNQPEPCSSPDRRQRG